MDAVGVDLQGIHRRGVKAQESGGGWGRREGGGGEREREREKKEEVQACVLRGEGRVRGPLGTTVGQGGSIHQRETSGAV